MNKMLASFVENAARPPKKTVLGYLQTRAEKDEDYRRIEFKFKHEQLALEKEEFELEREERKVRLEAEKNKKNLCSCNCCRSWLKN